MTTPGNIKKYLANYSVGDRWNIVSGSFDGIDNVVVIPALAESGHIFKTLASLSKNQDTELARTLVICVINNTGVDNLPADEFADNQYILKMLDNRESPPVLFNSVRQSGLRIAYVDASSPGLEMPDKIAGVGLARKIGMDLALGIFNYEKNCPKLLFSLDADTLVEHNYLSAVRDSFEKENVASSVIAFTHQDAASADEQAAICCYETFLRYYVLGLRWAGSPCAFHSVGSTMVCTAEGYAVVRGMNKRRAGEDFYFLDKLAKIGRMGRINTTTVHPSSRQSRRVPFGTGKRIISFTGGEGIDYSIYNSHSFVVIKEWLEYISSCRDMDSGTILAHAESIHPSLGSFLRVNHFGETWRRIAENSGDCAHLCSHFFRWFDGFKTFKLIRHLTNNGFPPMNMFTALRHLMEMTGNALPVEIEPDSIPPLRDRMKILDYLRELDR
ncbi:MAG: hypothetical protein J7K35_01940 [Syntrophobacterales bacterium]|nr:hypothetical protein [Syntrophobacterales bacterium]